MKPRRSRLELIVSIIELCQSPGIAKSNLKLKGNIGTQIFNDLLEGLQTRELIEKEIRPLSHTGLRRPTEYYTRTPEGDKLIRQFSDLRERLTT